MSSSRGVITVVGLGPGDPGQLTRDAHELLATSGRVFVRTSIHPTVDALTKEFPRLRIDSFDDVYEAADSIDDVYATIVRQLLELALHGDVVYCVPGSPSLDEATVRQLLRLAQPMHQPVRIIQGLSYLEPVLAAVGPVDTSWLTLLDATDIALYSSENAVGEVPGHPGRLSWRAPLPTAPIVISQIHDVDVAIAVKLWLGRYWPENHEVIVVSAAGTPEQTTVRVPIHGLDRVQVSHLTTLYVPAVPDIENLCTFAGIMNVTRTLRAPGGCPWDREQTHQSLKTHLIEEAYEVLETLDQGDYSKLAEELGDLLFQVTIHAQVAAEHDEFEIEDVFSGITSKLIRRHPHVFADMDLTTSAAVLQNWETFKQKEKPERESVLSGIPVGMPAIPYSYAVQKRVANQGFEWPNLSDLFDQVRSEIDEVQVEVDAGAARERIVDELGDILFALVSVGRRLKVDPEEALRHANRKFVTRFREVERRCKAEDVKMHDLSPEELDAMWREAKNTVGGEVTA